jgi:hypothetical protein
LLQIKCDIPDNEYYSAIRSELPTHRKTWRKYNTYYKLKEPIRKVYILYDSNCMAFRKGQNYGDSKSVSSYQGWYGKRIQ